MRSCRVSPKISGHISGIKPAVWVSRFHSVTSRSAGCIGLCSISGSLVSSVSLPDCSSSMIAGHVPVSLVSEAMSKRVSGRILSRSGMICAQP